MNEMNNIPINRTAANVIKRGINFEYDGRTYQRHHPHKIRTRQVPKDTKDLTGTKYGRFTVIGLYDANEKDRQTKVYLLPQGGVHVNIKKNGRREMAQRSIWVVRCCCGNYETRRTKAINKIKEVQDRCRECAYIRSLKIRDFMKRMGRGPKPNEMD